MTRKIEMADVVRAHMEVRGCPVLTSNQCYAIAMNLNCQVGSPTPPQPIYDEAKERKLFEAYHRYNCGLEGRDIESEFHRGSDGEYIYCTAQDGWKYWSACAQSRAKAREVGHE